MKISLTKDQDRRLIVLLRSTYDAINRARKKELHKYGISVSEFGVLFFIQAIGNKVTPADISRWMFREHHSVSALLNRMEKRGLITKIKDLERKNLVRVSITEKGKQVYQKSTKSNIYQRILLSLSEEKRQRLISYLNTLRNEALKELEIDYKPPYP